MSNITNNNTLNLNCMLSCAKGLVGKALLLDIISEIAVEKALSLAQRNIYNAANSIALILQNICYTTILAYEIYSEHKARHKARVTKRIANRTVTSNMIHNIIKLIKLRMRLCVLKCTSFANKDLDSFVALIENLSDIMQKTIHKMHRQYTHSTESTESTEKRQLLLLKKLKRTLKILHTTLNKLNPVYIDLMRQHEINVLKQHFSDETIIKQFEQSFSLNEHYVYCDYKNKNP